MATIFLDNIRMTVNYTEPIPPPMKSIYIDNIRITVNYTEAVAPPQETLFIAPVLRYQITKEDGAPDVGAVETDENGFLIVTNKT
jgi:hypothetical protein